MLVALGAVGALLGLALAVVGVVLLLLTGRDGVFGGGEATLTTDRYALVTEAAGLGGGGVDATVRVRVRATAGGPVFDPRRPKALIFARQPDKPAVLVGVMYSVQRDERGPSPGGPVTRWHSHVVCTVGDKRGRKPGDDGRCPVGSKAFQGSEMMHVWFTHDLRSAFAVGAPEPELCRDGLLSGAFCRSPGARRAM